MSDNNDFKNDRGAQSSSGYRQFSEEELEESRERGCEFLKEIVSEVVDRPEDVFVTFSVGDRTTVYKVECNPKNLGQLIGSKGKNINGIRAVISAMMARRGIRAVIEIPYIDPHSAE